MASKQNRNLEIKPADRCMAAPLSDHHRSIQGEPPRNAGACGVMSRQGVGHRDLSVTCLGESASVSLRWDGVILISVRLKLQIIDLMARETIRNRWCARAGSRHSWGEALSPPQARFVAILEHLVAIANEKTQSRSPIRMNAAQKYGCAYGCCPVSCT